MFLTRIISAPYEQSVMEQFEYFVNNANYAHYKQSLDWFTLGVGGAHILAISFCNGRVVCSSVVRVRQVPCIRKAKYFIERGPLFDDPLHLCLHLSQLINLLKPSMLALTISPYYAGEGKERLANEIFKMGFVQAKVNSHYQRTQVLSLDKTPNELYGGFSTKLRRHIKKAEEFGIECSTDLNKAERIAFYEEYEIFRQNTPGSGVLPSDKLEHLYSSCAGKKSCLMVLAKHQGTIVSGVVIFICGIRAIYEYGFRSVFSLTHNIPGLHLPLWVAIKKCHEAGIKYFDMGGYDPDTPKYESISRFKGYFGGKEQIFMGEFNYVPNTIPAKTLNYISPLVAGLKSKWLG